MVITDVSGEPIASIFNGHPLRWDPIGCPETAVTINLLCVTSQKSKVLFTPRRKPETKHGRSDSRCHVTDNDVYSRWCNNIVDSGLQSHIVSVPRNYVNRLVGERKKQIAASVIA
jgi:hypothetical protein